MKDSLSSGCLKHFTRINNILDVRHGCNELFGNTLGEKYGGQGLVLTLHSEKKSGKSAFHHEGKTSDFNELRERVTPVGYSR